MISDGSARRYVAGDTVVLRKGWSGQWDIDWACEEGLGHKLHGVILLFS